jgi:hypothetical protein
VNISASSTALLDRTRDKREEKRRKTKLIRKNFPNILGK